ncbi:MAG: hypothetical protein EA421_03660 [Gemmatimonadales bacterium]|nr:MAG: hypothetical protein EA421_03660 [Gemmatimonadales bacterium]
MCVRASPGPGPYAGGGPRSRCKGIGRIPLGGPGGGRGFPCGGLPGGRAPGGPLSGPGPPPPGRRPPG